jgi:hypothetical protein
MTPAHIEEAYERAWLVLKRREGDLNAVRERLSRLVLIFGRRHPDASAEELASAVLQMFNPVDGSQESGPVSD